MALLCFDVGNTHTHWGVVDGRVVRAHGELPTAGLDTAALAALLPVALELAGTDWRVFAPTRGEGADVR